METALLQAEREQAAELERTMRTLRGLDAALETQVATFIAADQYILPG